LKKKREELEKKCNDKWRIDENERKLFFGSFFVVALFLLVVYLQFT
jgi:hypothetical protein